jgi:hypothetical protein
MTITLDSELDTAGVGDSNSVSQTAAQTDSAHVTDSMAQPAVVKPTDTSAATDSVGATVSSTVRVTDTALGTDGGPFGVFGHPQVPASSFPSPFAAGDPVYEPYDNFIRFQPEVGQSKIRRRFTGKNTRLVITWEMLPTQLAAFYFFFDTTVQGILPFDWIDLRTNAAQTYRFVKRPQAAFIAGDYASGNSIWRVNVEMETVY